MIDEASKAVMAKVSADISELQGKLRTFVRQLREVNNYIIRLIFVMLFNYILLTLLG